MIQVTAAILIKENHVLAARRSTHKSLGGYWEFPGGKVEPGETPEESLARELLEELSIHVEVRQHFVTNEHDDGDKGIALMSFFCHWLGGELTLRDHDAVRWCAVADFDQLNWAPADLPIVNALRVMMEPKNQSIDAR